MPGTSAPRAEDGMGEGGWRWGPWAGSGGQRLEGPWARPLPPRDARQRARGEGFTSTVDPVPTQTQTPPTPTKTLPSSWPSAGSQVWCQSWVPAAPAPPGLALGESLALTGPQFLSVGGAQRDHFLGSRGALEWQLPSQAPLVFA